MIWDAQSLEIEASDKPQGWLAEIWVAATISPESIMLDDEIYHAINLKYRLPSLIDRIKSFARAAGEAAATGLEVRGELDTERVFSICAVCPYLVVDSFVCGQCGCHLKTKALHKDWSCGLGKWA